MTSPSSWYGLAHECRMRAAETRARADEMQGSRAQGNFAQGRRCEKNSVPWWDKKRSATK